MKVGDLIDCDAGMYDEDGDHITLVKGPAIVLEIGDYYIGILYNGIQGFIIPEGAKEIISEGG